MPYSSVVRLHTVGSILLIILVFCVVLCFVCLCPVSCVHGVVCFSALSVLDSPPLRFSLAFIFKTYSTPVITAICAIIFVQFT